MVYRVIIQAAGITWLDGDYKSYAEADDAIHRMAASHAGQGYTYRIIPREEQS